MSIGIQHGKKYITSAGFVVDIISVAKYGRDFLFATQQTSPGTVNNLSIKDWAEKYYSSWAKHCGWEYKTDGTIAYGASDMPEQMRKDLEIVSEYPYPLELPEGYKWAGGFPKLADVTDKGYYLTSTGKVFNANDEKVRFFTVDDVPHIGVRRIALESIVEPQAQYYLTDVATPTFYIYENGVWYLQIRNERAKSYAEEEVIKSNIRSGRYKSITKEEFEKLLTSHLEKKMSPSYPQYYIRTNGELYNGAVVVERVSGEDYRLVGNNGKVILLKQGCWPQVAKFVEEKVWIQISKLEADRLITGGEPALKYYVRSNGAKFSDGLVICRDWNDKCVTLGGMEPTPEYNWGNKDSYLYDKSWKEITRSEAIALLDNESLPLAPSVPVKKEEEMSKSKLVSVITTGGSMVAKATNYLYIEPAKIIGGYVKRSLRYIVFTGTIAGIIYGANNPDALKKRVASVLPKITIEAPSVLK